MVRHDVLSLQPSLLLLAVCHRPRFHQHRKKSMQLNELKRSPRNPWNTIARYRCQPNRCELSTIFILFLAPQFSSILIPSRSSLDPCQHETRGAGELRQHDGLWLCHTGATAGFSKLQTKINKECLPILPSPQVDLKALVRRSDEAAVKRWLRCVSAKSVREHLWPHLSEP